MSDPIARGTAAFSSRRSFSRSRSLVKLDDNDGAMLLTELAHATGMDANRQRAVLFGDGEDWSIERSPFALGQIVVRKTREGEWIELTDAGRAEVRRLRSEAMWARGRDRRRVPDG